MSYLLPYTALPDRYGMNSLDADEMRSIREEEEEEEEDERMRSSRSGGNG